MSWFVYTLKAIKREGEEERRGERERERERERKNEREEEEGGGVPGPMELGGVELLGTNG